MNRSSNPFTKSRFVPNKSDVYRRSIIATANNGVPMQESKPKNKFRISFSNRVEVLGTSRNGFKDSKTIKLKGSDGDAKVVDFGSGGSFGRSSRGKKKT
jgi:hypothetical protein